MKETSEQECEKFFPKVKLSDYKEYFRQTGLLAQKTIVMKKEEPERGWETLIDLRDDNHKFESLLVSEQKDSSVILLRPTPTNQIVV